MRKYVALVSQAGTSAPVSTVLANTLCGTPVWERISAGKYHLVLSGAFPSGKTVQLVNANFGGADWVQLVFFREDDDTLVLNSMSFDVGGPTSSQEDDLLSGATIEVRVYP